MVKKSIEIIFKFDFYCFIRSSVFEILTIPYLLDRLLPLVINSKKLPRKNNSYLDNFLPRNTFSNNKDLNSNTSFIRLIFPRYTPNNLADKRGYRPSI